VGDGVGLPRVSWKTLCSNPDPRIPFDYFYSSTFKFLLVCCTKVRYNNTEEDTMNRATPRYRRALVALDGSPVAESIVPFIVDIAGPLDMEIVLLRVVTPVVAQAGAPVPGVIAEELAARTTEARDYLARIAADVWGRGVRVQVRVRTGTPVQEILAAARESAADLIAMTTHGRSGLSRLVFGSVAEAVLRLADIPVLMMRLTAAEAHARAAHEATLLAAADERRQIGVG
jgi:nucleotide-binding universal stress UspA family protein